MDNPQKNASSYGEFFKPIDGLVHSYAQKLNEIREEKNRSFRAKILSAYDSAAISNTETKVWKKILKKKPITKLKMAGQPRYSEFDLDKFPGGNEHFSGIAEVEEERVKFWLRNDLRSKGVRLSNIENAVANGFIHPEDLIGINESAKQDRFDIISRGASKHSVCVILPEGLAVNEPFLIRITVNQAPLLFPVLLFAHLEKKSKAKIIIELNTGTKTSDTSILSISLISRLSEASGLDIIELQDTSNQIFYFSNLVNYLNANAYLNQFIYDQGSDITRRMLSVELNEPGAKADITGVYVSCGNQTRVYDTIQNHRASRTSSDLLFNGVLSDSSYSLWKGNVLVTKGTKGADGYQRNNNLLLSSSARAESIPGLEILADDVKCSHGVTLTNLDPDQIFYLQSRGIAEDEGTELIVNGFVQSCFSRLKSGEIKEYIDKNVKKKGIFD